MSPTSKYLLVLLVAAAPMMSRAQTTVYVPDINPQVPGGTSVNTIPFGSASYTFMDRIPASFMDPTYTKLNDIAFAPSASAAPGTWNASTVRFIVGHLPTTLPCPFTFPGPGGATGGSFLTWTVVYDSAVHGPLNWTWIPGQWSPLGLAALGGTNFVWNGIDDVGIYVTFTGASPTSGFHRNPSGPPDRTYATGFEAPVSTTCGSNYGLVVSLDLVANNNLLSVTSSGPGVNDLMISLTLLSPTATEGWIFPTLETMQPMGSGPFFGLYPDSLTWFILGSSPLIDGSLFHFPVPSNFGLFPNTPIFLPPGSTASLSGVTADFVAVMFQSPFIFDSWSPVARITF